MTASSSIQISRGIAAPQHQVYQAFASPVAWEHWFSDYAEAELRVSGRLYFFWQTGHHASGIFTQIDENEKLVFTWQGRGESRETKVTITLEPAGEGSQVSLLHTGLGEGEKWEQTRRAMSAGWESSLDNLKSVLETGIDQRLYQRPMLGIYIGQEMTQELADKMDLPISTGIQISGVVPGMGAEAAGLQADDILVCFNQHEIKTFSNLGEAIGGVKAGEIVGVDFYRGREKKHVEMTLSHRPLPNIPDSTADLADQVAQAYQAGDTALETACQGVTEAEAAFKPGEDAWSAKETLVHLVYTERWLHLAIACLATDQRTGGFANQPYMIKAMADCYSLAELVAELKRCEEVTIKSFAALPPEIYQDKRKYVRLVDELGQGFSQHTLNHIPQIENAIAAARDQ